MPPLIKSTTAWLSAFLIASFFIVGCRTVIFDANCDPKFLCLCSFNCLIIPILVSALISLVSFCLAYWLVGRGKFKELNKSKTYVFIFIGALLGFLVFGFPLITIGVIYGGYFMILLPTSFVFSLIAIGLAKVI